MLRYLDSSALLKLGVAETESGRLAEHLSDPGDDAVCSALGAVEVRRAIARAGLADQAADRVDAVLATVDLRRIDEAILGAAAELDPASIRTLDAIHLATALELGEEIGELVAYDRRLLDAAAVHGLTVVSP